MPDPEKTSVVSGYVAVQAVRRSGKQPSKPRIRKPASKPRQLDPLPVSGAQPIVIGSTGSNPPAARIGHTVLPPRHEIVCYECRYTFIMQGRVWSTQCPKCHKRLENVDHVVEGTWTKNVRTIGKVHITKDGVLEKGEILAREVALEGSVKDGTIETSCLQLYPGARFDMKNIRARDLVVKKGAKFAFTRRLSCRDVDIAGTLNAVIYSEGVIKVREGGMLRGEVHGSHLVIESGGGLKAKISVVSDKASVRENLHTGGSINVC